MSVYYSQRNFIGRFINIRCINLCSLIVMDVIIYEMNSYVVILPKSYRYQFQILVVVLWIIPLPYKSLTVVIEVFLKEIIN